MKIVIFNLRCGANLGDRLIAECLIADLRAVNASLTVSNEDLAGRDAPPSVLIGVDARAVALGVLTKLPGFVRRIVAGRMLDRLVKRRLEPRWRALLSDADAVVIGGGGIFADSDLNFPKKIGAALRMATERNLPVAIHAVGVSPGWSAQGKRLFGEALAGANLCGITVRDDGALKVWNDELKGYALMPATLAADPALTLGSHIAGPSLDAGGGNVIGLCLTSPVAIHYHSPHKPRPKRIEEWYCELAAELTRRGYEVVGFTTGASEDARFAAGISARFVEATSGTGRVAPPRTSATELVSLIKECRAIVAHRLHALIAGYALNIPGLALAWDEKMTGQMKMMGYSDRLADVSHLTPSEASDRIELIVAEGLDPKQRENLMREAHRGTENLDKSLRLAVNTDGQ